jgi:CpeT protein
VKPVSFGVRGALLCISLASGLLSQESRRGSDLADFLAWLPGHYSSRAFAAEGPGRAVVEIRVVTLWPGAKDGRWFYLEQAVAASLDRPYRQAVLRIVVRPDGAIVSENWDVVDRAAWTGAWKSPERLAAFAREAIKPGRVDIVFRRKGPAAFAGGTPAERTFPNTFRGAATFTNVSELTATTLYSWDRGWKADGTLAWGPEDGGYVFEKLPPETAGKARAADPSTVSGRGARGGR